MRGEEGFTIVEVLVAVMVLAIGILTMAGAFDSGRRLTQVSQRKTEMAHQAQQEIERVESLPYSQIAMSAAPSHSSNPSNPDYYVIDGTTPSFEYDRTTLSAEPLDVDSTKGTITPNSTSSGCSDGCTAKWSDPSGPYSGEIFAFVSWYTDGTNGANCSPGCPSSQDFKRITVAVTLNGASQPSGPVWVSTYKIDQSQSGQNNPLQSPSTTCQNSSGATVPCTNGLSSGTAVTYYLTDSPYTSNYSPPTADHAVHHTIANSSSAPIPDQQISSSPTTTGTAPPCYSTDIGCGGTGGSGASGGIGREIVPAAASGTCGTPPLDNTKVEFWVTSQLPVNTTVTGGGATTLYTQSVTAGATGVTLCMALYLETPTTLSSTGSGALLSQQIGSTVASNVGSYPATPTAISFDFNTGSSATVSTSGSRVGVALWAAASPQNLVLVYDHPSFQSSIQLIQQ